jgi:hypothetical protein
VAALAVEAGNLDAARMHVVALGALEPGEERHRKRLERLDAMISARSGPANASQ